MAADDCNSDDFNPLYQKPREMEVRFFKSDNVI